MAETVKKSRIVSDEDRNLEESFLEEFNMRLKNCMSNDDLQTAITDEEVVETTTPTNTTPETTSTENIYENILITTNKSPSISPLSTTKIVSNEFILNERENYYDTPKKNPSRRTDISTTPFQQQEKDDDSENIYELIAEELDKTEDGDQNNVLIDQQQQLEVSPKIEIEHITHSDCEQNTTGSDNFECSYEFVEPEDIEHPAMKQSEDTAKSVKDRMFLATDDAAATLLFTQTVTSPMLTPSEENIDFLKGFQTEPITASSSETPLERTSEENSSISDPLADEIKENIYENAEVFKTNTNLYESVKDIPQETRTDEEPLYENIPGRQNDAIEEHIYQDIDDCNNGQEEALYESLDEVKQHGHRSVEEEEEVVVENSLYDKFDASEETTQELSYKNESVEVSSHIEEATEQKIEEAASESSRIIVENVTAINESNNTEESVKESYSEFVQHCKTESNYYEKYTEVVSKSSEVISNREKDTETVPPEIVKNLKNQFSKTTTNGAGGGGAEIVAATTKKDAVILANGGGSSRTINIMKQINKFEQKDTSNIDEIDNEDESTVTETYTETTIQSTEGLAEKGLKKKKTKKSRKEEKENISVNELDVNRENVYNVNVKNLCRSFGDLTTIPDDRLHNSQQIKKSGRTKSLSDVLLSSNKKSIENVFSDVSVRTLKEKFLIVENKNPLGIVKTSFKNLKSSFNKFDALQKKNVLHVRSTDSAQAQEKFNGSQQMDTTTNNCKACSKAVFQMEQVKAEKAIWHKNCFRCTECSKQLTVETYVSHEGNLYCKPHFKSLFAPKVVEDETPPSDKPDLGLEELQSLNVKERFQVFEHHQTTETQQEMDRGPTPVNVKRSPSILSKLARFQAKGMDVGVSDDALNGIPIEESSSEEEDEDDEVPEGEDPTLYKARKAQKEKPFHFTNINEVKNKWEHGEKNARDERRQERKEEIMSFRNKLFMGKQGKMKEAYQQAVMQSESCANLTKTEKIESCDTKSLKERFEKGQMYNEKDDSNKDENEEDSEVFQSEISKKSRSLFLELDANASKAPQLSPITPPKVDVRKARDTETPEREIYHDPDVVRAESYVDDSEIAKTTHTASKMLNKFRQMEENLAKEPELVGPKPLKRFTPPPEPAKEESSSGEEESGSDEESEEEDQTDNQKLPEDLIEAQKAARAKQLRAKFEKWEAQEIKKETSQAVNIVEEYGEDSQVESTKSLRARFEQLRDSNSETAKTPRVKVNRFVEIPRTTEACESCDGRVYPLEKISVHGHVYHKNCFKCMECSCILRMESYSYNQGLLYCIPHFKRLFISKGNYDSAFGLDEHKEKWNVNATMA